MYDMYISYQTSKGPSWSGTRSYYSDYNMTRSWFKGTYDCTVKTGRCT